MKHVVIRRSNQEIKVTTESFTISQKTETTTVFVPETVIDLSFIKERDYDLALVRDYLEDEEGRADFAKMAGIQNPRFAITAGQIQDILNAELDEELHDDIAELMAAPRGGIFAVGCKKKASMEMEKGEDGCDYE